MRMKERKNLKRNTHRETDKHKAGGKQGNEICNSVI